MNPHNRTLLFMSIPDHSNIVDAIRSLRGVDAGNERTISGTSDSVFVVVLEFDLSLSTGYSINERESAVALLDQYPNRVRVICPAPAHPEVFEDPRIDYVRDHGRHKPLRYARFLWELRGKVGSITRSVPRSVLVFRLGVLPIVPALTVRDGIPVILKKFAGYQMFSPEQRSWKKRMVRPVAASLYRYVAQRCLGADIESYAYGAWLPHMFGVDRAKLLVVPNAANTARFVPMDRDECRRRLGWHRFDYLIGYVGSFDELRCIGALLEAAQPVLRNLPKLGLVLVGSGLSSEIESQIERSGLQDRILRPGFMPYDTMPSVINALDIGIDLSRVPFTVHSSTIYGSYSQKIAQYLACGVPALAWETEDTIFLDQEGVGRTVKLGDLPQLSATIEQMLAEGREDPGRRERARVFACERLSARSIAVRRMEFWERLVRGKVEPRGSGKEA